MKELLKECKITKLNLVSTVPDLWNKMNFSATKISFIYETLTEIFCRFGKALQCQGYMKFNGIFDESKDNTPIDLKTLGIIHDALLNTANEISPLKIRVIDTLAYCVHIGLIFDEYFMNKTKIMTKDNSDETDFLMKKLFLFCLLNKDQKHANGKRNGLIHLCQI